MRLWKKGKISPRYIDPYEIMKRVGAVANKLALPQKLSRIHDIFHILMLHGKNIPLVKVMCRSHSVC